MEAVEADTIGHPSGGVVSTTLPIAGIVIVMMMMMKMTMMMGWMTH